MAAFPRFFFSEIWICISAFPFSVFSVFPQDATPTLLSLSLFVCGEGEDIPNNRPNATGTELP